MNPKGAGRKPQKTYEELLDALKQYILRYPNKVIKLSDLERETNISCNIWKYNKEIRVVIEKLNNSPVIANSYNLDFTLPNSEHLVNANYSNKPKLIRAVQDCFDVINDLYDMALIGHSTQEREKKFLAQIADLKANLSLKDIEIEKLNKEIDKLYLDSESPLQRRRQNIKANLIEITPERIRALSKSITDIEKEYDGLFD